MDEVDYPSAKRSKPDYRVCGHCNKELSAKIYKKHKRLYYDATNKSWTKDISDEDNLSSSEFSSLDEFDVAVGDNTDKHADGTRQLDHDSDDSDCNWEEPLGPPDESDTTDQGSYLSCSLLS